MRINTEIYNAMLANNNMITTAQVVELGFSKMLLSKYVQEGLITRLRHGIYTMAELGHDQMYTLMLRSDNIIFSHESALYLNGLCDTAPATHNVTIPVDCSLPGSLKFECNCFYIKNELHQLGLTTRRTPNGNEVRCYDAERTICDIARSRSRMDEGTYRNAILSYKKYPKKDIGKITEYAVTMHCLDSVKKALEEIVGN